MEKFVLVLICVSIFGILLAVNISWTSKLLMGMLLFGMIGQSMFEDNPPPPGPPVAGAPPPAPLVPLVPPAPPAPLAPLAPPAPLAPLAPPAPLAHSATGGGSSLAASQVAILTATPSAAPRNLDLERVASMKAATRDRYKDSRMVSGLKKRDALTFGALASAWALTSVMSNYYF